MQRVHGKSRLYSATHKANLKLSVRLRRSRDKARLFLLKSIRNAIVNQSGDREQESVGASPSTDISRTLQEGAWPINTADAPRFPRNLGRIYWPRISKQLSFKVGPSSSSPDTFFKYYSFNSIKAIHRASNNPATDKDLSITDISLAIGITPRLFTSFIYAPSNHYRKFVIGKRGGGDRIIHSPRTFLKVVQYWILDYLLYSLTCHENCHSYQKGKSILSNSLPHVNRNYVANIDIENFFPSITQKMVFELLRKNDFGEQLSKAIARVVTLENSLPQGAPTSPIISNAILHDFDEKMSQKSHSNDLFYTRYADDISISGKNKEDIIDLIYYASKQIESLGLKINKKKSRIASKGGQQKVTGLIVNEVAQPPRQFRRKIRAIFHHAESNPKLFIEKANSLRGYVSYLQSFPNLKNRKEITKYKEVCRTIERLIVQSKTSDQAGGQGAG